MGLGGLVHLYKMSSGYFITTILNLALPFLILPVLTRYISPSGYGTLALFSFYLTISNSITGVSMPAVISKHFYSSDKKHIAEIIGNSILIVSLLSVITILVILAVYPFMKSHFNLPLPWLVIIPLASFSFIVFSMGLDVLRNSKKILIFGKHQIGNTAINLFISLIFIVILLWGWQGRALGIMLSYFISALISYAYLKKNGFVSYAISKKTIKQILKIVIPLIPNSFQSVMIAQVGIYFIQYYYSKELLGLYSIGFQLAFIVQLLATTLSIAWSPYLFEHLSNEKKINKLYLARLFYALFGVLFAGVILVNIASGHILRIMTTPDYFGAHEFIPWFTLGFFFHGVYILIFPILIKNDKQKYISLVSFINMLIVMVLNVLFIELFGYIGVAIAYCLAYFIMFIAYFWKTQKIMPLPWLHALKIFT